MDRQTWGMEKPPTGQQLAAPPRPQTASRAMMGQSLGPVLAPPGTAARMSAGGRLGTALARGLQVLDRPVTQGGGLGGLKTAGGGQGRQVLDVEFFLNELRFKKTELLTANSKMKVNLEATEKSTVQYKNLEKRLEDVSSEVKSLQGELADMNLVLDCAASETSAAALRQEVASVQERVAGEQRRLSAISTEKAAKMAATKDMEDRLRQLQASMEERLSQLDPQARKDYHDLQETAARLRSVQADLEEEIGQLDRRLLEAETKAAGNPAMHAALQMQERVAALEAQRAELVAEAAKPRLRPEEQRRLLMVQIKADNEAAEAAQAQARAAADAIRRLEQQLQAKGAPASGSSPAGPEAREKHEKLVAQERDLDAFLESFAAKKAERVRELHEKQNAVVGALERLARSEALDSGKAAASQAGAAAETVEGLREELAQRKVELSKIELLEAKLGAELAALTQKMDSLKADMETYGRTGDLGAKAMDKEAELEAAAQEVRLKKESVAVDVAALQRAHDKLKASLAGNEKHLQLTRIEEKMKPLKQAAQRVAEASVTKEANRGMLHEVTNLALELNNEIKKAVSMLGLYTRA